MASDLEWQDARRLARYVRQGGRCGLHRDDADRLMGWTIGSRRRAFGLAYSQGWIDVCGAWLVTPPKRLPLDPAVYRLYDSLCKQVKGRNGNHDLSDGSLC